MQKANSFDTESLAKIGKGALIAAGGAAAIALLDYFGQIKIDNPMLASFSAWIIPVAINAVKEWRKGVEA